MADHKINIIIGIKQKGTALIKKALGGIKSAIGGILKATKILTGALLGAGGITAFFVKAASDAEESESKFKAVFKELSDEVREWSNETARATNRSAYSLREYLSVLQDTFVPMGMARDEAAELSKKMVKLAIDVASFNNKSPEETVRDFQSALVGNTETVRKYGIVLTESSTKLEAVRMGLSKTGKDLSEQAKIQARLSLIMKGSTDAQGDAERTSKSFANRIKGLLAAFKDLRIEIGGQIIKGANLGEVIANITKKMGAWLKRIRESKEIQKWAAKAKEAIGDIADLIKGIFEGGEKREIALKTFGNMGRSFMKVVSGLMIKLAFVVGKLIGEGMKAAATGAADDFFSQDEAIKTVRSEMRNEGKLKAGQYYNYDPGVKEELDRRIQELTSQTRKNMMNAATASAGADFMAIIDEQKKGNDKIAEKMDEVKEEIHYLGMPRE